MKQLRLVHSQRTDDERALSEPRKHHVVPRFYLAAWADERGFLLAADKLHGTTTLRTPGQTAYVPGLYAWSPEHLLPGTDPLHIEKQFLNSIETSAAPIIERLRGLESPAIAEADVPALATFVAAQIHRSPTVISQLRRRVEERAANGFVTTPNGKRLSTHEWLTTAGTGEILALNIEGMQADAAAFRDHAWSVRTTPSILLTSDAPVIFEEGPGDYYSLAVPLSPVLLLLAHKRGRSAWVGAEKASHELVAIWNHEIARAAKRWVVDQPGRKTANQLVERLRNST